MSDPMERADLPFGYFGPYRDNEVRLVSTTKADPVKFRGAVHEDVAAAVSNLAALSGNVERRDGEHEEFGYVMVRKFPDGSGAIYFAVRFPGEQQAREVFFIGTQGLVSQVGGIQGEGAKGGRFYHEGGRFVTIHQDDGHIVTYDMSTSPWTPLWSNWHGLLKPLPWTAPAP